MEKTTTIEQRIYDYPVMARCRGLKIDPNNLLPNQLEDIRLDAIARKKLTGSYNGDPAFSEDDE